jgi:hypothetical protein
MAAVGLPTAAIKVTQYFLIINFRITLIENPAKTESSYQ